MSWRPKVICVGAVIWASCGQRVMGDHRVRLAHERIERLLRPAAHEGGELIDIVGLGRIKLGREAPGKDALDDHLR